MIFFLKIVEAYGQTEATALVSAAVGPVGGNVGFPVSCNKIKLADIPDMGLLVATSGRGEICIKGHNVMKGYYKRPDLTSETIDENGWLHTGDIGEFQNDGSLKIVDRKKHIFKLAQGEYVAPEKVESIYGGCPLVGQVFVDGMVNFVPAEKQWFTIAIVVPDEEEAFKWAKGNGLENASLDELCFNKNFTAHVLQTLRNVGKEKGLNGIEQIRSLHLHSELFTIEQELLTPSMKNRRPQLRSFFKTEIESMYNKGSMTQ